MELIAVTNFYSHDVRESFLLQAEPERITQPSDDDLLIILESIPERENWTLTHDPYLIDLSID